MKKFFLFLIMATILGSCSYDDDKVWDSINNLSQRMDSLENKLNTDIHSIQTLLDTTKLISSVSENANGYVIVFNDNTSLNITYSEAQTPNIGVALLDGVYYWTINGEFLTDKDNLKIQASGASGNNGNTPQLKITENYWYVSTDDGSTWTQLGKASGNDGDSFFKNVAENETSVIFTLSDNSTFEVAKFGNLSFSIPVKSITLSYGKSASYVISSKNIADISISKPDGWRVNLDNDTLTISAPNAANSYAETNGYITCVAIGDNGLSIIRKIEVCATTSILSFEDIDASFLAGPTSYGANLYSDYADGEQFTLFYDEKSDLTMGINESFGSYEFCNGGIAISQWNDMTTDGYANQCSVFYTDNEGNGGNNGSKTFAVCYGYKGGYGAPFLYFLDGNTERTFSHFYVNNATYTVLSMNSGDTFAKKFSYADQDWLKLTIEGFDKNEVSTGTVDFYLADFRTADAPGIVNEWTKVDLSSLGNVHKLIFDLTSSDNGTYGMNTPGYFCFDDLAIK